jgi:hypothetical protein
MIAEVDKTHEGLVDLVKLLIKIIKVIRGRGKFDKGGCDLSAAHLMATYGILPLIKDICALLEHLKSKIENPPFKKIKVRAQARWDDPFFYINPSHGYVASGRPALVTDYVTLYVQPDLSSWAGLGIDLGNLASIAWERVPFSFVIDWAFQIGTRLQSLTALNGVLRMYGCRTRRVKANMRYQRVNLYYSSTRELGKAKVKYWRRHLLTTIPMPDFPTLDFTDSFEALKNALALLHQLHFCKGK